MADLGFGIAGLVGTVDACIKVGRFLVQAYKDYNQADIKVNELSVRIQICWSRIVSQLEITKKLESGMTEEQRDLQSRVLRILQSKLDAAVVVISKPNGHAASKRTKALHFLNLRESLESTVSELESWQRRFEPSWFEVIKTGHSAIDGVLHDVARSRPHDVDQPAREALRFRRAFNESQSVMLGEKILNTLKRSSIPFCKAEVAVEEKEGKYYIVDTISQDTVKLKHARELATRLRDSNPFTFGTLKCKGIVRKQEESSLVFVFRVPDGYSRVQSCRELLLSGHVPDSLTKRLNIARQLATAVYFTHLYDFVHKNITPETILTLEPEKKACEGTVICLVGFQLIRFADAQTNTLKADRKDVIYQHPSRTGNTTVKFVMQHDIYSLGVCLLEIGLWQSLVQYDNDNNSHLSDMLKAGQVDSGTIKARLTHLSRTELRVTMGDVYSKVVETCLTCLDEDNVEFGDPRDFEDEDGVMVGSRYVERILDTISTINY
ncbi:hypothetical protein BKA59DRAFT_425380 [Fusarium tricinctum]|uniref:Protein kinase domain-containing protein n=1 Tax=Fusarium tricinctum TaxID=61284 RepID=A0A8K0W724_9HYPO|nr:hypothetical protein BKA59DRAFT_425380 [Fusarium tricinctum]